jgi:uncharacterized membrane protein YozB (DUF420 family)
MAAIFMLPILFAVIFALSMVILIIGSWIARILGFINGNKPNLFTLFAQISVVFAILYVVGFMFYYNKIAEEQPWIN